MLFASKFFPLPIPTRPGTRTFLQVPNPSRPEVQKPYPSGPVGCHRKWHQLLFLSILFYFHFISIYFICNPVGCHRKWHSVRNSKAVGSTCISLKTARGSHFAKTRRKKTSDWKTPLFLRKKDKQEFTILDVSHMFISRINF